MKKLILTMLLVLCMAVPVSALNLMFLAQQETLTDGETVGYKLGPSDYEIPATQCLTIKTQGTYHLFVYNIQDINVSQIETAMSWDEFQAQGKGVNVMFDAIVRGMSSLGVLTPAQTKTHLLEAQWKDGDEYPKGSMTDWETGGSLEPVRFWPSMGFFGSILEDIDR